MRRRGVELLEKGWKQTKIAEALGVSQSSVSKWKIRYKQEGRSMLKDKPLLGAPRQLTKQQEQELIQILKQGAQSYGFDGDFWNYKRIKRVFSEAFSIDLSVRQSGRILKRLGFSKQKPQTKPYQQDQDKVKEWKEQILPELKKTKQKRAMILFADESSVQLLPNLVHTYAQTGHRPILKWYKKSQKVYIEVV